MNSFLQLLMAPGVMLMRRWRLPAKLMLLFVAALVLIKPGWATDVLGLALVTLTLASQRGVRRPSPAGETA